MITRRQKPKRTRLPRGQGRPRPSRVWTRRHGHKLCNWVQQWKNLQESPSFNVALEGKYIIPFRTTRPT